MTLVYGLQNIFVLLRLLIASGKLTEIKLKNGLRFYVRNLMDLWIIKETCLNRDYEKNSIMVEDGWTVIDIGAGLGDFAIDVAVRNPNTKVIAVEPFLHSFEMLKANIELNGVDNVEPVFIALSSEAGVGMLYQTGEAVQHTTTVKSVLGSIEAQEIRFETLPNLLIQLGIERCNYLKIDCEGCEFDLLLQSSEATLKAIDHICLEYHNGFTDKSHHDLINHLEKNRFKIRVTPNPVHGYLGFLYAWRV